MVPRLHPAVLCAALLLPSASGADGAQAVRFFVAPGAADSTECSEKNPCSLDGATLACQRQTLSVCHVTLADGVYLDPAINIYYYRAVVIAGNCETPGAVVLRATKDGTTLVTVQDHAIGVVQCVSMETTGRGTISLAGRQNAIVDFNAVDFGDMNNGHHLSITEHSTASCIGPNTVSGGAHVHLGVSDMSKINVGCPWHFTKPAHFSYFMNAVDFSKINAQGATYSGEIAESTGIRCNSWRSAVYAAFDSLPGDKPGNCDAPWR